MKLLYCSTCNDVLKLRMEHMRSCHCGASWGRYLDDDLTAQLGGVAIPLGINNSSLQSALNERPARGSGSRFESFVIPHSCDTVNYADSHLTDVPSTE